MGLIVLNPAFSYQTFYPKIMLILHYIPFKSILCIRFVDLRMLYSPENCFSFSFSPKKEHRLYIDAPCITYIVLHLIWNIHASIKHSVYSHDLSILVWRIQDNIIAYRHNMHTF